MAEKFNFGEAIKESGAGSKPFDVKLHNVSRIAKTGKKDSITLLDDISVYFKV